MTRELSGRQEFTSGPVPRHLRHLPVESRGFPVPHVSEWTDESPEANERRGDRVFVHVDYRELGSPYADVVTLDPKGIQGNGAPKLAKLHPTRQRECLVKRICSICGRKASPEETLAFIGVRRPDSSLLLREPGMHRRCAAFATFTCPGINRTPLMEVAEARTYEVVPKSYYVRKVDGEEQHVPAPDGDWVPYPQGYLRGLLLKVPDDAPRWPLAEWRDANAHLLELSGKRAAQVDGVR